MKHKWILWTGRILSLAVALFFMVFSLDVFGQGLCFGEILIGLLMHNIPSFILFAIVFATWKKPLTGGIIVLLISLLMIFALKFYENIYAFLSMALPLILSGILMIVFSLLNRIKSKG